MVTIEHCLFYNKNFFTIPIHACITFCPPLLGAAAAECAGRLAQNNNRIQHIFFDTALLIPVQEQTPSVSQITQGRAIAIINPNIQGLG